MKSVISILFIMFFYHVAPANPVMKFKLPLTTNAHTVGDLLIITNDVEHVSSLPLDSKPVPGETVSKKQIVRWIKNHSKLHGYKWLGKTSAVIPQYSAVSGGQLVKKAALDLQAYLDKHYQQATLISKNQPKPNILPLSAFSSTFKVKYPVAKQVCVTLYAGHRSIPIWFHVKAYQKVLVASRMIKGRTIIQPDEVSLELREISGLREKPLTTLPTKPWLKRTLHANQIITTGFLIEKPDIVQGSTISIQSTHHDIQILTTAIALQDGIIGQKIKVQNSHNKKSFMVIVRAENQADILS